MGVSRTRTRTVTLLWLLSVLLAKQLCFGGSQQTQQEQSQQSQSLLFGPSWNFQDRLVARNRKKGDRLGRSVAISGTTIAAGAYWATTDDSILAGSVVVFTPCSVVGDVGTCYDRWRQRHRLTGSYPATYDQFGEHVAIYNDTLVVSAPNKEGLTGSNEGIVNVFVRVPVPHYHGFKTEWQLQGTLTASKSAPEDMFGSAVSVYQNTIVVGAYLKNAGDFLNIRDVGGATVYVNNNNGGDGSWQQQAILNASDGLANDMFGEAVSVNGNTIVVGARGRDTNSSLLDTGAVYIFQRDTSDNRWHEEAILTASDLTANHGFGAAVDYDGQTLVVGAFRDNDLGAGAGAAYLFTRDAATKTWSQTAKLHASDGNPGDQFSSSVAVDGNVLVIGAHLDDYYKIPNVGSAYVFRKTTNNDGTSTWVQEQKLMACDYSPGDGFGYSVDIAGNYVVVGAYGSDSRRLFLKRNEAGAVYVFKYDRNKRRFRRKMCAINNVN